MKLKKGGDSLRFLILGLVLFSFNVSQASVCKVFLDSEQITHQTVSKYELSVNLLDEIFHKFDHLKQDIDLNDISKYLSLNDVLHTLDSDKIVILPEGNSPLNRFARLLALVSANASLDQVAGVTELIFDPTTLKESKATGMFRYGSRYDSAGFPIGKFKNSITLSFDAIIDLKATSTEFHELVHWKAYFQQSQMNLDSLAFGSLNLARKIMNDDNINFEHKFDFEEEDQNFNFSFEELPAHLLGMTQKINDSNKTEDEEYKDDLAFEIVLEIEAAKYYARKMKTVVNTFFKKSIFKNIEKINPEKLIAQLGIDDDGDVWSTFHHEMLENIVLTVAYGHDPQKVGLEYELKQSKSYWSMFIPIPKGYETLGFFSELQAEQVKDFQVKTAKSIYYRMYYLRELIAYVDQLHQTVVKEEQGIDYSPIEGFHRINRAYKDKIKELGLN